MRNIKLILEYDGTDFAGWQRQLNENTIQAEVERSLSRLLQEEITIIGAGRTDSGVHARGQVANFKCVSQMNLNQIKRGLIALLPDSISIIDVEEVPVEFHARYSAKSRTYSYLITKRPSALLRSYSWFLKYTLNFELLVECAKMIEGLKDFEAFSKANSNVKNYLCEVRESTWIQNGYLLKYEIEANRFLHGMVRALIGTMIDVSRGYTTLEEFRLMFEQKDRSKAGQAAPPKGLVLEYIKY